ncbi:nucleotidyltransferase family protein [Saccharospirillum sp. MSK14-1]|uniref:nucleotidyltransferase family protein n=1 Tax=Saccharospirillum sp. MSK14-1 TaxID=1897632 RepID=UPI001E52AA0B|nr:nucleotidyltransferase family protein [Saccharospirillum sp. MSK14-1]
MSQTLIAWLRADRYRMALLQTAAQTKRPDWCLAAGFVRNLVWDRLHGYQTPTPLTDVDLIYFDRRETREPVDRALEARLNAMQAAPWSVKNQARMHQRNGDAPYQSTADAMSYWVEVETAVGVRLNDSGEIEFLAPFGLKSLMDGCLSLNQKRPKPEAFAQRQTAKSWLNQWPLLKVHAPS